MEVQKTTVTELEARSVTELQEIVNAAKEDTMICVSLEVPDDERRIKTGGCAIEIGGGEWCIQR